MFDQIILIMKTTPENWQLKLNNLHSRTRGITSEHQIDYKRLLKKVFIGKTVLDVGCGTCWLSDLIPQESHYYGIDAYKLPEHQLYDVFHESIENIKKLRSRQFETLFVFAALDGMQDLVLAFKQMKALTAKNIVILTGVEIEPDLYHTHKITMPFILEQMDGFKMTFQEYQHPKIVFLEFTKL